MRRQLSDDSEWEAEMRQQRIDAHFDALDRQQGILPDAPEEPDLCLICEQEGHETDACPQAEWNQPTKEQR